MVRCYPSPPYGASWLVTRSIAYPKIASTPQMEQMTPTSVAITHRAPDTSRFTGHLVLDGINFHKDPTGGLLERLTVREVLEIRVRLKVPAH